MKQSSYQKMRQDPERLEKYRAHHRAYDKKWRKNNSEYLKRHREEMKRWWKNNPEEGRKRSKANYEKHREQRLEYAREYRKQNRLKIYLADKKRMQNPQRKLSVRIRVRILMALKRKTKKSARTEELIGTTISELKTYLEKQFKKGMTWDNHGKWHIDHRLPVISFDLTKPEEQKKAFHYTNLQPLWAEENLRKAAKILN